MAEAERRIGQEGSRWYNERPSGEDLAGWFKENVEIHEGLDPAHYVQGITLIPATEKPKEVVGFGPDGSPMISTVEHLVYVPYAKVETRVKYFHDLMASKQDEWLGVIEPVLPQTADKRLPPGFFTMTIPTAEDRAMRFICCTMKVTVYKRGTVSWHDVVNRRTGEVQRIREGETVIDAPPATKMIPTTKSGWGQRQGERAIVADESSLMKAETGAVGRALGMAGMLVIPGTGVATAEDMNEALSAESTPSLPTTTPDEPSAQLPPETATGPEELSALRAEATQAIQQLQSEKPDAFALFQTWAQERGIGKLTDVHDAATLRGLTAKATKDFEEAEG